MLCASFSWWSRALERALAYFILSECWPSKNGRFGYALFSCCCLHSFLAGYLWFFLISSQIHLDCCMYPLSVIRFVDSFYFHISYPTFYSSEYWLAAGIIQFDMLVVVCCMYSSKPLSYNQFFLWWTCSESNRGPKSFQSKRLQRFIYY